MKACLGLAADELHDLADVAVRHDGHEPELDHSDDCYLVYTCGMGHEHPECWRCLPYYGGISKRVLKRLYACRERIDLFGNQ